METTLQDSTLPEGEEASTAEIGDIATEATPHEPLVTELLTRSESQRNEWLERIRGEVRLPAALRDRLASAVEQADLPAGGEPQLTITQVAGLLAEAVPSLLGLAASSEVVPHPAGEAFFRSGQLSDDDATRIAREQLARTGFGR